MPSQLSKRIAGRVTGACSHTVPVLVPCVECVEKQLDGWEQRIRDESMKALTDDMKNAKVDAARWKAEVAKVKESNEDLIKRMDDLRRRNESLATMLKDSVKQAEDLRAQLHAEQAVVHGRTIKMVADL